MSPGRPHPGGLRPEPKPSSATGAAEGQRASWGSSRREEGHSPAQQRRPKQRRVHATGGTMASAQPILTVVSNICARSVGGDH